jgi:hypothetical protein
MEGKTNEHEREFDYNLLRYGPTTGRRIYVARINWEFLEALRKGQDPESLKEYDIRADPLGILAKIETPRILIPKEVDSQGNVIYGQSVPITQSPHLVPGFFDGDFFNDFYQVFAEEPKREDYQNPTTLKQNPSLIKNGKEGLRAVISRRKKILGEEETLRGTKYSQRTNGLKIEGLYDGSVNEYLISLEERKRQIQALSELGDRYLEEMS